MLDKKIIDKIEEKANDSKRLTTTDCQWLAGNIGIGETTLKRMLGFTSDSGRTPHRSTLNIIAEFLGYKNYDAMALDLELDEVVISDFDERDAIETDTLNIGDIVEITYLPNRLFSLKYVGDCRFIIEKSSYNIKGGTMWSPGVTRETKHSFKSRFT